MLLLALGCATPDPVVTVSPVDSAADTALVDSGGTETTVPDECPPGAPPPTDPIPGAPPRAGEVWSGSITWTVHFDLLAHAQGHQDCSYTRVYEELVETGGEPWVCPACAVLVKGTATIVSGYEDCYLQISDNEAERTEELGIGEVDGALRFFRAGNENVRAADVAAVTDSTPLDVAWTDVGRLDGLRTVTLSAAGSFTRRVDPAVVVEDPQTLRAEPYACGWPRQNPGGPNTSWSIADGAVFPNFRLDDQCGEPVSLWDFRDRYVVIDASSPNCGPCQEMATAAPAFEAELRAECVDVATVTLLNESLSAVNLPASIADREGWAAAFALDAPVLGDLGLGYALFPAYQGRTSGMSLPSWVVLDPQGRLLGGGSGFSTEEGGFAEIRALILADAAARAR